MGQGEVGWYIHPKGENSTAVCGFGCKKNPSVGSLHKWSWKTAIFRLAPKVQEDPQFNAKDPPPFLSNRMVKRKNGYIEHCYVHGRRPVLSHLKNVKSTDLDI